MTTVHRVQVLPEEIPAPHNNNQNTEADHQAQTRAHLPIWGKLSSAGVRHIMETAYNEIVY